MSNRMSNINIVEESVKGLLRAGVKIDEILVGIHNACVHGEAIADTGGHVTDASLKELFAGFETSIAAATKMK